MMMKPFMLITVMTPGFALGLPAQTYAQNQTQTPTDQTDQSEDDWRQSRKKSGTSDIYRTPNSSSTGVGTPIFDVKPISPVDQLPSESRRHVMRERAKAIAESPDGDISDATFEPSDSAMSDEQLMRAEQRAWEHVTQSGSGNGSTQDVDATGQSGGSSGGAVPSQQAENAAAPSQNSARSAESIQDIMDAIKSGQSGQAPSDNAGEGQSEQGQSDGSGDADNQGVSGSDAGSAGSGEQAGDAGPSGGSQTEEPLSPLELIRQSRADRPAEGKKRSASDYLGKTPQR